MKKIAIVSLALFGLWSCSGRAAFKKDRAYFEASKVKQSFKSIADMNDSYFEIRENNFFEFYKVLYDSVKNSSYPGKYTKNGDTLYLHFYNKKGYHLLGKKAMIDTGKQEILFFDKNPGVKKRLLVN